MSEDLVQATVPVQAAIAPAVTLASRKLKDFDPGDIVFLRDFMGDANGVDSEIRETFYRFVNWHPFKKNCVIVDRIGMAQGDGAPRYQRWLSVPYTAGIDDRLTVWPLQSSEFWHQVDCVSERAKVNLTAPTPTGTTPVT
jgi:hypothetical protein